MIELFDQAGQLSWRFSQEFSPGFACDSILASFLDPSLFSSLSYNRNLALPTADIMSATISSKIRFVEWHTSRGS